MQLIAYKYNKHHLKILNIRLALTPPESTPESTLQTNEKKMIYNWILVAHITTGSIALLAALFSVLTKMRNWPHQWHRQCGQVFVIGMLVIFVTAVAMSLIKPNLFLFLISFFSVNFAISGWRYAKNKNGKPSLFDYSRLVIMMICGAVMLFFGSTNLDNSSGLILLVFAITMIGFCVSDYLQFKKGSATGKKRIAKHLTAMLGGTISTVTAVLVVNASQLPQLVVWLGPTLLLTPLIIYCSRKVMR